jgi:hypothetical protein
MEPRKSIISLLDDPDQDSIRADLKTFFGPRADVYLAVYEKMRGGTGGRRLSPSTWSWPAFFGSFVWFFYRKMYIVGAVLILAPMIFAYLFGSAGGGGWAVVISMFAKGPYVQHGLRRILKADSLGLHGLERSEYLERAGGLSVVAGGFAGLLYVSMLGLVIFAALARR